MAQPDSCPDVSNGAIIHSPVIICSELDNPIEREEDEGEEEDDEVELAEEVGEDVLMMVGVEEGQVEGEKREMKVAEDVQTIQVFPLPNGVLSEESVGGGIQEENNERGLAAGQQGCEIPDEQKSNKVLDKIITEEMSHETDSLLENHCQLCPELQVEKHDETHVENSDDNKEKKDEEHKDEETNLETNEEIEEKEKHEETHLEGNVGIEEKEDGETHLENSKDINEIEQRCINQDIIMSSETELKADNSEGTENGFEEHELSCTDGDKCQDSPCHEQESKETEQLSFDDIEKTENITIDDGVTDRSEDLLVNSVPDTIEQDQNINQDNDCEDSAVNDCSILTDVTDTIEELANHTNQQTNDFESEIKGTNDNNQSSQQKAASVTVMEDSSQQSDSVESDGDNEGGKDCPQDVISEPQVVQEMESEVDQMVDQPEVAIATNQEQSATAEWIKEEQIDEIGDFLEEEEKQVCYNVPNVMDVRKEGKEEDSNSSENNVGEPVCKDENKGTDDKDAPENVAPAEDNVETDIPEPELQCMVDVSSESKQGMDLIQAEEAFEMDEENPLEPEEPEDDSKSEENESTTQEAGDFQEHPTQTLEEPSKDAEGNSREPQKEQGLAEECMAGGPATDPLVEEPVTILDDEFDEIEDTPATELDDPTPESSVSHSDDLEEAKAEPDGQNNEMQQDVEREAREGAKAKEDDREVFLELNERVRGLKEALENGILGVEPQPSNKEECRPARVSSSKRKDDDWIKKNEPEAETTTEAKEWKKEPKPIRKDFWESERARKETPSPDEKGPQRRDDWITELKSVIKDESLPKRRDEQVKKKRVVLFEDGRSYFPHREETTEKREEVTLISHKKVDGPPVSPVPPVRSDDKAPQDQVYEVSLYVKVNNIYSHSIYSLIMLKPFKMH